MAFEPRILRLDEDAPAAGEVSRRFHAAAPGQRGPMFEVSGHATEHDRSAKPGDEDWLPDELQELAAQLGADAAYLTARQPWDASAQKTSRTNKRAADNRRHWLLRIGAAAVLMMVSLGLRAHWRANHVPPEAATAAREATGEQGVVDPAVHAVGWTEPATGPTATGPNFIAQTAAGADNITAKQIVDHEPSRISPEAQADNVPTTSHDEQDYPRGGNIAEVSAGSVPPAPRLARDEVSMLQAQISAFEKVIGKLQAELRHRDQLLEETTELVKTLSAEVETLRKERSSRQ
jgi:hypothetical protein